MSPHRTLSLLFLIAASLVAGAAGAAAPAADPPSGQEAPAHDAHTPPPETTPPFELTDETRINAGKARFNANCAAYCHGHEGSGGKTPAFKGRADLTPGEVFKVITEGRRGADVMPAWGNGFSSEKRWELVAYIMSLTRQPAAE